MRLNDTKFSAAAVARALLAVALLIGAGATWTHAQPTASPSSPQVAQTQSAAPQVAENTGKQEASKSEEDELNVYRHAPIVQTISRVMHMQLETTARLLEYINFAVLALALGIPLVRILPRILHHRRRTLQENLDSARRMTDDARSRLAAVEAKLAKLDDEIAQIRAQAEEEAKGDEARIKSSIGEESARIVQAAEQEIASATAQARRGLRTLAAELAVDHAARQLVLTPEADRALIDEFVRDAATRGQN